MLFTNVTFMHINYACWNNLPVHCSFSHGNSHGLTEALEADDKLRIGRRFFIILQLLMRIVSWIFFAVIQVFFPFGMWPRNWNILASNLSLILQLWCLSTNWLNQKKIKINAKIAPPTLHCTVNGCRVSMRKSSHEMWNQVKMPTNKWIRFFSVKLQTIANY